MNLAKRIMRKYRHMIFSGNFKKHPQKGINFVLPSGDRFELHNDEPAYSLFVNNSYEDENRILWEAVVKRDMMVFDIGSNWGLFTISGSRLTGENGKVYSFEPNPSEREKLTQNVLLNKINNITIFPIAVSDKNGMQHFYLPPSGKGAYSSIERPNIAESCTEIKVVTTTIDSFLTSNEIKRIDTMKIDVEGAELLVLKGAEKAIESFKPFILMEVSDRRTSSFGYHSVEICNWMQSKGFVLFIINECKDGLPKLKQFCPSDYISYNDIFCIHKEKLDMLDKLIIKDK